MSREHVPTFLDLNGNEIEIGNIIQSNQTEFKNMVTDFVYDEDMEQWVMHVKMLGHPVVSLITVENASNNFFIVS